MIGRAYMIVCFLVSDDVHVRGFVAVVQRALVQIAEERFQVESARRLVSDGAAMAKMLTATRMARQGYE